MHSRIRILTESRLGGQSTQLILGRGEPSKGAIKVLFQLLTLAVAEIREPCLAACHMQVLLVILLHRDR